MRSYPYRVIEKCSLVILLVIVMASYIHCQLANNTIMVDDINDDDNNLFTDSFSLTEATVKPSTIEFVPGKNKLSTTTNTVTASITTSTTTTTTTTTTTINTTTKPGQLANIDPTTSSTAKPIFTRHQFMIMMMPPLPNVSGHTGKKARNKHLLVHKKIKSTLAHKKFIGKTKLKIKPMKKSIKNGRKSKRKFRPIKPIRLNKMADTMGQIMNNTLVNQTGTGNECDQTDMNNCSQKLLMITDKKFHYPANITEMNNRCK